MTELEDLDIEQLQVRTIRELTRERDRLKRELAEQIQRRTRTEEDWASSSKFHEESRLRLEGELAAALRANRLNLETLNKLSKAVNHLNRAYGEFMLPLVPLRITEDTEDTD